MCCLSYENDYYAEAFKQMPKLGSEITTPDGKGARRKSAEYFYFVADAHLPHLYAHTEHRRKLLHKRMEYGIVVIPYAEVDDGQIVSPLKPILRLATARDEEIHRKNLERKDE